MTRLSEDDLCGLIDGLEEYDRSLLGRTGLSLLSLAARAAGLGTVETAGLIRECRLGVLPVSAGGGIIPGFAEGLAAIGSHLGFEVLVPSKPDAAGLAEIVSRGASLLLAADDSFYGAYNLATGRVIDNGPATGLGFVVALDAASGGIKGREVLVIGCGPVGLGAARACCRLGARVALHDLDMDKARVAAMSAEMRGEAVDDISRCRPRPELIVEATTSAAVVGAECIGPNTFVAAPGVPLGLTPEAEALLGTRLIHDPLQIGTVVMLVSALVQ